MSDREHELMKALAYAKRPGFAKNWLTFVCCPFFELDWLERCLVADGFHPIDCELLRNRNVKTAEFCRLIEWQRHTSFALFVPRLVPTAICRFLYNAADDGIVSTESDNLNAAKAPKLSEKSWVLVMTPEDFADAELVNGWDRHRLTNALSNHCWLAPRARP